jgi:DNA-directed RNA polymerase subunit RPC12/RpoP
MNDLQEAPASVTYSITTKNGFPALFTVRDMTGSDLIKKMVAIEAKFIEQGIKPQLKVAFGQKKEVKYVEGKVCPQCGSKIVEKTKADGHIYFKCEKGGWDRTANKPTGCDYVDWNNPKTEDHTDDAGSAGF